MFWHTVLLSALVQGISQTWKYIVSINCIMNFMLSQHFVFCTKYFRAIVNLSCTWILNCLVLVLVLVRECARVQYLSLAVNNADILQWQWFCINMGHRRSLSPSGVATLQTFPHVHTDIPLNGFCRGKHFYSFGRFIFSLGANKFPFLFLSHECRIWITITRTASNLLIHDRFNSPQFYSTYFNIVICTIE